MAQTTRRRKPGRGTLRYRIRKAGQRTTRRLAFRFGARAIRYLIKRCELIELNLDIREDLAKEGQVLFSLWHGRSTIASPFFARDDTAVLVSVSDDGKVATTILDELGYEIIRGSSNRGGVRALRELIAALKAGKNVAITPDGPRGPMHAMSPGVAFLARATGTPIVPVGLAVDKYWSLSSWDHYTVPKPGARVVCCYRPPLTIPRKASAEELSACSTELRRHMREAEVEAYAHLGLEADWIDWVPEEEVEHAGEFKG